MCGTAKADEEKARKLLERANSLTSVRVKLKLASIYYQSGQIEAAQNIYDELMLEFDDFDKEPNVNFAYPTYRIVKN